MADQPQTTDPVTALVRLRAAVCRLAHEAEAMQDLPSIRDVRTVAPLLAHRLRDLAMTSEMVEACRR